MAAILHHEKLRELIESVQKESMIVVEVGVFLGDTSLTYLDIVKRNHGKFYAIDWFKGNVGNPSGEHKYQPENYFKLSDQFRDGIFASGYSELTTCYNMPSLEAAEKFKDKSIDFCFIDADHRYSHVSKDIRAYLPKVKKGGILAGHDYPIDIENREYTENEREDPLGHIGVSIAVKEIFGNNYTVIDDAFIWYVRV